MASMQRFMDGKEELTRKGSLAVLYGQRHTGTGKKKPKPYIKSTMTTLLLYVFSQPVHDAGSSADHRNSSMSNSSMSSSSLSNLSLSSSSISSSNNNNNTETITAMIHTPPHTTSHLPQTPCPCQSQTSSSYCIQPSPPPPSPPSPHPACPLHRAMATTQQQIETCLLQQQRQQQDIYRLQLMCSDRQMALDTCSFKIVSLEKDLKAIHLKCLEEESQIKSIQHFKDTAKRELEELGQGLFEEARQMVLREQHEKQHLKVHHDKTQTDLEAMHHHLAATQSELEALRETMAIKEQTQDTQDTQTPVLGTACERTQMELAQWHGLPLLAQVAVPHKDSAVLTDFDVFVSALPTLSLRRMHSLPFMKQCLRDDIEPCLRLGPNALITSRKVLEAVLVKTCFVEKCPPALAYPAHAKQDTAATTASLWERFQFSPPTARCQACGREQGPFSYRFRISYFDEWATIDRYCRDRIASVIAFYDYLSRLKAGAYYHWPLGTVYEECKRLRLQMCLSRMGALPAMLMASGVDPTVIGKASVSSTPDNKMSNHTRPIVSQLSSFTDSILTVSTFHSHA